MTAPGQGFFPFTVLRFTAGYLSYFVAKSMFVGCALPVLILLTPFPGTKQRVLQATTHAFLRFFTRPWTDAAGERRPPRMTTGQAMGQLRTILALPQHRFLPDDLSFNCVSMRSLSGFKQWNDAYLIALAAAHKLPLATLERKLDNMDSPSSPVVRVLP